MSAAEIQGLGRADRAALLCLTNWRTRPRHNGVAVASPDHRVVIDFTLVSRPATVGGGGIGDSAHPHPGGSGASCPGRSAVALAPRSGPVPPATPPIAAPSPRRAIAADAVKRRPEGRRLTSMTTFSARPGRLAEGLIRQDPRERKAMRDQPRRIELARLHMFEQHRRRHRVHQPWRSRCCGTISRDEDRPSCRAPILAMMRRRGDVLAGPESSPARRPPDRGVHAAPARQRRTHRLAVRVVDRRRRADPSRRPASCRRGRS